MNSRWPLRLITGIFPVLLAVLPLCGLGGGLSSGHGYSFAVVPQFEPRKLYAIWKPIIDELQRRSGVTLKLNTTLSVAEFEREWWRGSFDFTYANPYLIVRGLKKSEYLPLVRDEWPLRGIVLVRKQSPIQRVEELDGKLLAVPSVNALASSLVIRAELKRLHGIEPKILIAKTHTSSYLHAANGLTDAAGGTEKTFGEQDPDLRDELRILYTTRGMPSHPVAAHRRIPEEVRESIRQAFLAMAADPAGAKLLAAVPMRTAVPASEADYRQMDDWGLEQFWEKELP